MSFILDALKKSEHDRQRQQNLSLAEFPIGRPHTTRPLWLGLVIVLLLLNVGMLAAILWRHDPSPTTTTTLDTTTAPASITSPHTPTTDDTTPATRTPITPEIRSLHAEAQAEQSVTSMDTLVHPKISHESNLVRRITEPQTSLSATIEAQRAAIRNQETVPTLNALGGTAALNLPELRMDIHVYSNKVADRFVFINKRKYIEGQTLTEGPTVQSITHEGVILGYQGRRFMLRN